MLTVLIDVTETENGAFELRFNIRSNSNFVYNKQSTTTRTSTSPRESPWPNKCVSETDKYLFCSNYRTLGRESFPKTRYIPKREGPKCVEYLFLRRTTTEPFRNQAAKKFLLKRSDGSKMLAWALRLLWRPLTARILVCFVDDLWCTYC